jgi:protein-S-isoprenylcysteine O-methyltransferase
MLAPSLFRSRDLGTVALLAASLGAALGLHAAVLACAASGAVDLASDSLAWCAWVCLMCAFHLLEFALIARAQPDDVSTQAFLLDHSAGFLAALALAVAEFWAERLLVPQLKRSDLGRSASAAGLTLALGGQAVRSLAMAQAGSNFTHLVRTERVRGHELVRRGVYARLRHPAYFGWFWWSIGTQLLLCNPVCVVAYAVASWRFFADRIPDEERYLLGFFGDEYSSYARATVIGIPFVHSPAAAPPREAR